jgi:hypothetical protein
LAYSSIGVEEEVSIADDSDILSWLAVKFFGATEVQPDVGKVWTLKKLMQA